ncbi:OB-fold-containig protein [Sphingomicrobium arenosum]|uniref:OB-fold-containig protein n=1 Tax=Sphingomicrobium arenosum TaxID=2233861 RepID=UPI00223F929F|nr:OB-fold-containig protein [Sphingomicrobium arenosum]
MFGGSLFPFAASFAALFLIALMQVVGIGELMGDADAEVDVEAEASGGAIAGLLAFLGLGKLPLLMWLALLLFLFSGIGFSLQLILDEMAGFMLSPLLAVAASLTIALPLTGRLSGAFARILPRDETTAIARAQLVGKRGELDIGTASRGNPARARITDFHGQTHHVMVEPHEDGAAIHAGDALLLVRREGDTFFAITEADRRLGPVADA